MNNWTAIGRLCGDPEKKEAQDEKVICSFRLAVPRGFKVGDIDTDFIPCVAFGKTAEFILKFFTKGKLIAISDARVQSRSWKTKEGENRSTLEVVVSHAEFCGPKTEDMEAAPAKKEKAAEFPVDAKESEEDLPF